MNLTFSMPIQAADTERRIIAGRVMEYGAVGHTSAGPVIFEHGSIEIPSVAKIKLLAQHDSNNPIGRAQSFSNDGDFINASFKISASAKGTDYLTLASEDLISGLSVGVEVVSSYPKDGNIMVTSAIMKEVSLVESPAYENAQVTKVAASAENNPTTESEAVEMTTAPEGTASEPVADAPVIEASRPVVSAAYTVGEVRSPIKTHANYMEHKIKASLGVDESRDFIRAADGYAKKINAAQQLIEAASFRVEAANNSFTTNPAFSPVAYAPGVIDATVYGGRQTIDALGGTLPITETGMTISHPKITTAGTVGTVAEGGSTTSTQIVSSYVDATVVKCAGQQIASVELLLRSGPQFYAAMYNNMLKAYNRKINALVVAEIVSGGTQAATQAATIAGLQAYFGLAVPAVYAGAKELPTAFIAGTSVWSLMLSSLDTTGRPLFNAAQPNNSNGAVDPQTLRGNFLSLPLWVDAEMVATTIDDCAFITTPSAIAIYESPVLEMSVNVVATGEINTMLFGFAAAKTLISTGLQRFNLT